MRKLAAILLVLFSASVTLLAAPIDGKWQSEREVGDADGKTYGHTTVFTFKTDGTVLTGTIVQTSQAPWMRANTGKPFEIQSGQVEGNRFSFKIVYESPQGQRTSVYEGTFDGDQMKGVVKFRGIGQKWDFDAKRAG